MSGIGSPCRSTSSWWALIAVSSLYTCASGVLQQLLETALQKESSLRGKEVVVERLLEEKGQVLDHLKRSREREHLLEEVRHLQFQ